MQQAQEALTMTAEELKKMPRVRRRMAVDIEDNAIDVICDMLTAQSPSIPASRWMVNEAVLAVCEHATPKQIEDMAVDEIYEMLKAKFPFNHPLVTLASTWTSPSRCRPLPRTARGPRA